MRADPSAHTGGGLITILGYAELVDCDFRIAGELCESRGNQGEVDRRAV